MLGLIGATLAWSQDQPVWLLLNLSSPDSLLTTDPTEKDRLLAAGWKQNAEARLFSVGAAERSDLHRMIGAQRGVTQRLFAARGDEIAQARKAGFSDEGVIGRVALRPREPHLVPVRRFAREGRFLWLIDTADQPWIEKAGWRLVGDDFWVWPAK
jgi:hypothetical protein